MFLNNLNYIFKIGSIVFSLLTASAFVHAGIGEGTVFLDAYTQYKSNVNTLTDVPDNEAVKFFTNVDAHQEQIDPIYQDFLSTYHKWISIIDLKVNGLHI